MTPKQNEPADLVVAALKDAITFARLHGFVVGPSTLILKQALTLAKLQSEAVAMLHEYAKYPGSNSFGVRVNQLLRAIEEAKK